MKLDSWRWDSTPQPLRLSHVCPFKLASTLCPHRVHFLFVATNWFSLSKAVEADPIRFSVRPYYCYIYEPSRFLSFFPHRRILRPVSSIKMVRFDESEKSRWPWKLPNCQVAKWFFGVMAKLFREATWNRWQRSRFTFSGPGFESQSSRNFSK